MARMNFMKFDWDPTSLQTSRVSKKSSERLPGSELNASRDELSRTTINVTKQPYNPAHWQMRAICFQELRLPELAAGDAYKAEMLCEELLEGSSDRARVGWIQYEVFVRKSESGPQNWHKLQPQLRRGYLKPLLLRVRFESLSTLISALRQLGSFADAMIINNTALSLFLVDECLNLLEQEIKKDYDLMISEHGPAPPSPDPFLQALFQRQHDSGQATMVSYPWIPKSLMIRQVVTILEVNKDMDSLSDHQLEVRPSKSGNRTANGSFHGVFARKDIKSDHRVFHSCGPLNFHARKQDQHCYNCGTAYDNNYKYYHSILETKYFKELFEDAETAKLWDAELSPLSNLIWLRVLAMCVKNGGHPLKHPMMTRLLGQYKNSPPIVWNFELQVKGPLETLKKLGVDIYANLDYDFWVLQTIWHRLVSNWDIKNRDGHADLVSCPSLYPFFNHSCEPTIHALTGETGISAHDTWHASRDIKAGEEVFMTLIDTSLPKAERQEGLNAWLVGDCACERCQDEE